MKIKLNHRVSIIFLFVLFFLFTCASAPLKVENRAGGQPEKQTVDLSLEWPVCSPDDVIPHTAYTLKYNEKYEQAEWVAYKIIFSQLKDNIKRKGRFRVDPDVKTGSADPDDYTKSGYDKGHLAPAADMKYSELTMSESFYMSNMSPQKPGFNRGIWKCLEEQVRSWAEQNEELYIVTAGILKGDLSVIGKENRVGVPKFFYKVILDYKEPELKAIAFILPNEKSDKSLESYAVTIDQVEKETGIDFFPALPDNIEEKLESSFDLSKWQFEKCK